MTIEKRKRGRPKKEVIRQIETPENIVSDEKDLDDILNNLGNQTDFVNESQDEKKPDEIQNLTPIETPGGNSNPNNFGGENNADEINDAFTELINPEIVISIFNTLIVFTGKLVFKYANIDGNHEELNLTKDEMRLLKPSVSEWLKTLDFKLTPLTAMLLSIGMIYASKIPVAILNKKTDSTPGARKYTPRKTKGTGTKRGSYKKKTIKLNLGN
jgi:hypothetical protein